MTAKGTGGTRAAPLSYGIGVHSAKIIGASVPIPKFVSFSRSNVYELRNRQDTSKRIDLVWPGLKVRMTNSRHQRCGIL